MIASVLLFIYSYPCGILLLLYSTCRYNFAYPCWNFLFVSSKSLRLSLLRVSSPHPDRLLLVLIPLLLFITIDVALLLISSPSRDLLILVSLLHLYYFAYPSRNHIILVLIFFSLSGSSYTCPDSFASTCHYCRCASPCRDCIDFSLVLMLLKHYQRYQKLWQGVNLKKINI